jgi:hypothetical protein
MKEKKGKRVDVLNIHRDTIKCSKKNLIKIGEVPRI